jgi:hypothetical protein
MVLRHPETSPNAPSCGSASGPSAGAVPSRGGWRPAHCRSSRAQPGRPTGGPSTRQDARPARTPAPWQPCPAAAWSWRPSCAAGCTRARQCGRKTFSQSWIEGPRMLPSMCASPGQRVQLLPWVQEEQPCKSAMLMERTSFSAGEFCQMSRKRCLRTLPHLEGELHAGEHVAIGRDVAGGVAGAAGQRLVGFVERGPADRWARPAGARPGHRAGWCRA